MPARNCCRAWAGRFRVEKNKVPRHGKKPVRTEITGQKQDSENLLSRRTGERKSIITLILLHF